MAFSMASVEANSTNFSSSPSSEDAYSRLITVVQFDVIASLGVIVNILPLAVTIFGYVKRSVVNCMVANLAFSELVLCLSFLFGQSFIVLWREWLPDQWCQFLSFIHFVAAFACFMFPPMLAMNRYVCLYQGEHVYERLYTKRRTIVYMISCWIFCSLVPLIFQLAGKTGFDEDNYHCCMVVKDTRWIVLYFLLIILPLICFCDGIMIYCNYMLYKKLSKHASGSELAVNVVRDNRELLYFLMADMAFPICFHSTYHLFKFILMGRTSEFLRRFFISLYLVNSAMRGSVTITMLKPYRRAVRRLLCGKTNQIGDPSTNLR